MMKKKLLTLFLAAALVVNSQGILYASAGQQGSAPEVESEEIQKEVQMEESQTGKVQTEELPTEKAQTEETEVGNVKGKTESEVEMGVGADTEEETLSETGETGTAEEETVPEAEAGKKEESVSEAEERTETEFDADTAVQSDSSESGAVETTENTDQGTWDTTQPVVEEVIFPQKDTTLKVGDTLQFQVRAYDADSGIKEVTAQVSFNEKDVTWRTMVLCQDLAQVKMRNLSSS